jgi:hypothetical protein
MADVMAQIGEGIALHTAGDHAGARALFAALWARVDAGTDPLVRCAIAHAMADVEPDPRAAVEWDVRALAAADEVDQAQLAAAGTSAQVADLYPSLHLNLAAGYERLGDASLARHHIARGRSALAAIEAGDYADMIEAAFARIEGALTTGG